MNWHVLYTKSRSEKAVAAKLSEIGIEVYCPLLKTKKRWSDRWKWVEEPLFKSYCFVKLSELDREKVFSVKGVVRYLFFCGKPAVIRQEEIDLLKRWLNNYDHNAISTKNFTPNDKVALRSGALMNQTAEVIRNDGNFLVLKLEDLGMMIKVDLRENAVEKV